MTIDSGTVGGFTRRAVIRSAATGAVLVGVGALGACASGGGATTGGDADGGTVSGGGEKTEQNPFGVEKGKPIEVVIFDGGYGKDYGTVHVEMYNKAWGPGAKMTATVKIASTLQPKFSSGNPPEVILNGGADSMPFAQLAGQNQLSDLAPLLDAPSIDDPAVKISDILLPDVLDSGSLEGVMYQLNYVLTIWGIWYSKPLFDEKGWKPAATMDEFMALCETIKSDGSMSPFIHTGVHTYYMTQVICQQAVKAGGRDVLLGLDNLEPDAWTNDTVLATAKAWEQVAKEGYIFPAAVGQDHTTSQTEWLNGSAAMIPCGSWLENEMKGKVPDGFDMVVQPVPALTDADALPYESLGGGAGSPFIIPAKAENQAGAFEYLRIMLSSAGAATFAEKANSLCAIKGASDDLGANPSTALRSVADAAAAAGDNMFAVQFMTWYSDLNKAALDATRNLLSSKMSADQYVATMQKAVDSVAKDSRIKKFTRT